MFCYKNVHEQINIFHKTIIIIFSNFIPNKLVTFDYKGSPWMTKKIKRKWKTKCKHEVYRDYLNNSQTKADYMYVQHVMTEVSQLVSESKDEYYNKLVMKLNNHKTSSKTYWSISKTFYNGRIIPIISPLLNDGRL